MGPHRQWEQHRQSRRPGRRGVRLGPAGRHAERPPGSVSGETGGGTHAEPVRHSQSSRVSTGPQRGRSGLCSRHPQPSPGAHCPFRPRPACVSSAATSPVSSEAQGTSAVWPYSTLCPTPGPAPAGASESSPLAASVCAPRTQWAFSQDAWPRGPVEAKAAPRAGREASVRASPGRGRWSGASWAPRRGAPGGPGPLLTTQQHSVSHEPR